MAEITFLSKRQTEEFPNQWYTLAQAGHFWMDWRLEAFLRQARDIKLDSRHPLTGMDIGCGDGVLRRQLETKTSWMMDGADINLEALQRNACKTGKTYFYDIFDRNPQFEAHYDFILLFDVLEHISEQKPFLDAVQFHLKEGGWLLINVPALESMRSRYDLQVGHVRRYNRRMMAEVLTASSFDVIDSRYWGLSMLPLLGVRKILPSRKKSSEEIIREGFQPPHPSINNLLKKIMKAEIGLFPRPPLGTSLLTAAVKRRVLKP